MEIKTCEEYVLNELKDVKDELTRTEEDLEKAYAKILSMNAHIQTLQDYLTFVASLLEVKDMDRIDFKDTIYKSEVNTDMLTKFDKLKTIVDTFSMDEGEKENG